MRFIGLLQMCAICRWNSFGETRSDGGMRTEAVCRRAPRKCILITTIIRARGHHHEAYFVHSDPRRSVGGTKFASTASEFSLNVCLPTRGLELQKTLLFLGVRISRKLFVAAHNELIANS